MDAAVREQMPHRPAGYAALVKRYRLDVIPNWHRSVVASSGVHRYRYIDLTLQTEAMFRFIERTIDEELVKELTFLARYDRTKKAIQDIVDMPDRQIDLFIGDCLQNNGRLAARKRASHFNSLSDEEVARMEDAVQQGYRGEGETDE